jgi:membrane-associated PAP2 superfamily phosphatase
MIERSSTRENCEIFSLKFGWIGLIFSACLILVLGQFGSLDLLIEDYYYDPSLHSFPWKNNWFAKELMHHYIKNFILGCGFALYLFLLVDLLNPLGKVNSGMRLRLRFIALASVAIPSTISMIKQHSVLHCPWDIDRYHGGAPFLELLDHVPMGIELGACFPAGHAATGLWLASLCVFWLPHNPKKALCAFMLGLGFGFMLGWVQQMRGAHFLFHTLWSMWIASLLILAMLQIFKTSITTNENKII